MYIWAQKNKKNLVFTLKMKFLPNHFAKMFKFWIKTVGLHPKMYIWSQKNKKFFSFNTKNEVFAQKKFY